MNTQKGRKLKLDTKNLVSTSAFQDDIDYWQKITVLFTHSTAAQHPLLEFHSWFIPTKSVLNAISIEHAADLTTLTRYIPV